MRVCIWILAFFGNERYVWALYILPKLLMLLRETQFPDRALPLRELKVPDWALWLPLNSKVPEWALKVFDLAIFNVSW
jgi:hypothetical protein